jgi:L-glyceraldehyde 3-phosphate reductase
VRALNELALARGQSLAQMAIAWVLRDGRVTSALIGASHAGQITELVGALQNLQFSCEELAAIELHAVEGHQPLAALFERSTPGRVNSKII